MASTADGEAPSVEHSQQDEHTHEDGGICEQHQVVFDLTILVPKAQIGGPSSTHATKFDRDDIDSYIPLFLPSSGADILRDVRQTVADSAEGFWLGMHSFDRVQLDEKPADKEGEDPTLVIATGKPSEVFTDSTDLAKVFEGEEYRDLEMKRAVRVVPTPYTDSEARTHVLRLRDTMLGHNVALQSRMPYKPAPTDPNALTINAGQPIYPIIRGPIFEDSVHMNGREEPGINGHDGPHVNGTSSASKKAKGKGKAKVVQSAPKAVVQAVNGKKPEADTSSAWLSDPSDSLAIMNGRKLQHPSSTHPFRTLQFSAWNPPPPQYRMKGHFLYLSATTVEGENLHITACERGFYVNRSDNHHFDPLPRQPTKNSPNASQVYQSLYDLFAKVSPQFAAQRQQIVTDVLPNPLDFHAGTAVSHCVAAAPWLVSPPDVTADAIRSQIPYALTGSTNLEALPVARDWNEEHTAMRELPQKTNDDRLVRDRFGSRLLADFQSAALRGVQAIARGDLPCLNTTDSQEARSYLFHNILFTQALDSMDMMKLLGGDEAVHVSSSKDLQAVTLLSNADVSGVHTICTAVVDYAGERWVAQSIPPGIFNRAPPEEAKSDADLETADAVPVQPGLRSVYGPKDTEKPLDGYVAEEAFAKLAENIAKQFRLAKHTVADTHGKETELWLPADVHGVAAADGRSYVIDLCRVFPVDVNWLEQNIDGQILGEGEPSSAKEADKYPHRMTLLRPELLETYHSLKTREWIEEQVKIKTAEPDDVVKNEEGSAKAATEDGDKSVEAPGSATSEDFVKVDSEAEKAEDKPKGDEEPAEPLKRKQTVIDVSNFKLSFNPDAFVDRTDRPLHSLETAQKDAEDAATRAVRDASDYIRQTVIPSLLVEVINDETIPLESGHLSQILHKKGINIRYLGLIAEATKSLPEGKTVSDDMKQETLDFLAKFRETLYRDMIVRASKHVLRRYTAGLRPVELAECISHFLNSLLGEQVNPSPSAVDSTRSSASWTSLTPASVREQLLSEIRKRFRYAVPPSIFGEGLPRAQLLREICLANGIQMQLKQYRFAAASGQPETNGVHSDDDASAGKKKKAKSAPAAASAEGSTTFTPDDVLNVYPIAKKSLFRSAMTEDMFERGQLLHVRGSPEHGEAFLTDALNNFEQVYGPVHSELAEAYRTTANLYHRLAQPLQRRIALYESLSAIPREEDRLRAQRDTGFESEDALNQAKSQHELYLNQAARLARQAVVIMERTTGNDSAETLQAYNDLAIFEHAVGNGELAVKLLKHVVDLSKIMFGDDHPEKAKAAYFGASMVKTLRPADQAAPIAYYKAAEEIATKAFGPNSVISTQAVYHLGQCHIVENQLSDALPYLTKAAAMFTRRSGAESESAREANQLLAAVKGAIAQQERGELDKVQKLAKRLGSDPARAKELISRMTGSSGASNAAGKKAIAGLAQGQEEARAANDRTGSRGHLDVDELVQFIQGGSGSSSAKKGAAGKSKGKKVAGKR